MRALSGYCNKMAAAADKPSKKSKADKTEKKEKKDKKRKVEEAAGAPCMVSALSTEARPVAAVPALFPHL